MKNIHLILFFTVPLFLFKPFSFAEHTPGESIRSPSEIVSIMGRIGEGRLYSEPPLKFPGRILSIELKNLKQAPEDACLWGSEITPGSCDRECRVWVEFCGMLGRKAVGVFDITVTYEK